MVLSLRKVKLPGGTELDWQEQISKIEEAAINVRSIEVTNFPEEQKLTIDKANKIINNFNLLSSPSDFDFSYYEQLVETDPNLALAGLRMELERMLQNLATINGLEFDRHKTSPGRFSSILKAKSILPEDQHQLLRKIIVVANDALHGRDVKSHDALVTIESANPFKWYYIKRLLERDSE